MLRIGGRAIRYLLLISILILSCDEPTKIVDDEPIYHDISYEYIFGETEYTCHVLMSYTTPDGVEGKTVTFVGRAYSWKSATYQFLSREYIEYDAQKIDQLDRGWTGWRMTIYLDGAVWKEHHFQSGDQHKRLYGTIP